MTRFALARLSAVVALVVATVVIAAPAATASSRRDARADTAAAGRFPSATTDLANPEITSAGAARDGTDTRHSSERIFAATLAALGALVALAARRGINAPVRATRAATARFAARRRGPPLLPTS